MQTTNHRLLTVARLLWHPYQIPKILPLALRKVQHLRVLRQVSIASAYRPLCHRLNPPFRVDPKSHAIRSLLPKPVLSRVCCIIYIMYNIYVYICHIGYIYASFSFTFSSGFQEIESSRELHHLHCVAGPRLVPHTKQNKRAMLHE